jgi:hypothetical protein
MRKFIIKYINHEEQICTIWLEANTRVKALDKFRAEYHDIKDFLMIKEVH